MTSVNAPHPMRLLVAWPEVEARMLKRAITTQCPTAEVVFVPVDRISEYVKEPGYYHVLYLYSADWRAFTPQARKRLATRVNLIILGPDVSAPADLADTHTALYFSSTIPQSETVELLVALHVHLAQNWTLDQCVVATDGRLALVGNPACWPDPPRPAIAGSDEARPVNNSPPSFMPQGLNVGQVTIRGDWVVGTKIVQQSGEAGTSSEHSPAPTDLQELLEKIDRHFDESELSELCFTLNIDYENIKGETKKDKARELILYLNRREQLHALVETCRRLRPNTLW